MFHGDFNSFHLNRSNLINKVSGKRKRGEGKKEKLPNNTYWKAMNIFKDNISYRFMSFFFSLPTISAVKNPNNNEQKY